MGQLLAETGVPDTGVSEDHPRPVPEVADSGFRPDIQGLRAVAVGVVVLYHLWPKRLSGGYVGVDVFFVISGFLISSHLWREASARGTIGLRAFYARRALRLLPAAILVLICTAVASLLVLPEARWATTFAELVASAAYAENWLLAHNAVDYLLQFAADSPVQHFWSLSVEEQFYAGWPLLILTCLWAMTRLRPHASPTARRRVVIAALATVFMASLAYSIYATATEPKQAYFVTPTRVWEFAAGGLCALLALHPTRWRHARATLGWLGLAAILTASATYLKATPFPGYAALLPVLGTAAVLLATQGRTPLSVSWWLSLRPATALGDISYAVYLWHWPILVLLPMALHQTLNFRLRIIILAATLTVSWLSTNLVETPLRRAPALRVRRWPSLAIALSSVAAMTAFAFLGSVMFQARVDAAAARFTTQVATNARCHGAAVFDPGANCPSPFGEGPIMAPALAIKDQSNSEYARCDTWLDKREIHQCDFGPDSAPIHVAVIGDSHALQWLGAVELLGQQGKWRAKTYFKSSCPFADAIRVIPGEAIELQQNCTQWQKDVIAQVVKDTTIDYVLVTAFSHAYAMVPANGGPATPTTVDEAFRSMWKKITDSGKKVVVLRDTPSTLTMSIPECIERNMDDFYKCAVPRDKALVPDPISQSVVNAKDPHVVGIDVNGGICDARYCYGLAGNVIVYRDTNHLTWQYAETLAPRLWTEFQKAAKSK
jgi:peptidoglycan/LPS O-acetylase OafA/YrhL